MVQSNTSQLEWSTLHTEIEPPEVPAPAALIVDVEARSLFDLSRAFRAAGYRTFGATSFPDAKRLLIAEQPHVLVADVRLGEFNGIQLLMLAREVRPDIAAVITNSFADSVLAEETRRLGGTFLVKPLNVRALLAAVQSTPHPRAELHRRQGDRRSTAISGFHPERRIAERRLSERRRST